MRLICSSVKEQHKKSGVYPDDGDARSNVKIYRPKLLAEFNT